MQPDIAILSQFFLFRDGAPTLLLIGNYQPWLVFLSFVVASLTSSLALQVAGMAQRVESRMHRQLIVWSGAAAMGGGVWAMHFVGMLAFQLCTEVRYSTGVTALSMVPSLLASWVALNLLSRGRMTHWQLALGGLLVGAGIGAMHYTGMAAMRLNAQLRYDPGWFAASIVVAVLLAMLALWIRFGLEGRLRQAHAVILGGMVMGGAIAGMHYTAMGAARFIGQAAENCVGFISGNGVLALAVTVVTLAISALTAGATGLLSYRRLNQELRAQQSRMQAMLDTAVDGVITIDGRGVIRSFNQAAERLFGWSGDEVIGRNVSMLMTEADIDRATVMGVGRDVLGKHRDGRPLPIRLAIGRVEQPGEALFVGFVSDISERKKMEQALRDSEQQYRSLMANSPGVNFRRRVDADARLILISDAVQSLTGWPARDFLDDRRRFGPLIHADDRLRIDAAIDQAIALDQPYSVEYRLHARAGEERWVSETGRGVRDAEGRLQWVDGVMLDITESKQLQRALEDAKVRAEQAAAAKSAFLANMSHEIRTPMNAILGFTELLLETTLTDSQRKHLGTVRGSARSLLGLLNDILDTAKLDRGAVELERVDFSMRAVCEQTLASLGLLAQRKGLALQLDYPGDEAQFFQGDPLRIQQVLLNLVGNAIKFTEQGVVTLRMRTERNERKEVRLSVIDTGIGIAPDRLQRIFDPFAQADASTTRRFGGTGLGTTISRQLVERMGGRIAVDSTLGEGSCFDVWLPLPAGAPVQVDLGAAEGSHLGLPPLRLLVADDVVENSELMQVMLSHHGHRVRLVGNGLEALQAFEDEPFDVVLMDVHMPELDGLGAARQIRELEIERALPRTPIIALTASVLEEDRQAALAAGMDGFATKPVEWPRLIAELARVLGLQPIEAPTAVTLAAEPVDDAVLNCEHGMHLWGGADAWQRALRRFAAEQADGPQRLAALLAAENWLDARALTHRWRGAAGSLALPAMLAAAPPLEEALRLGQRERVPAFGAALGDALVQTLAAIADLGAGRTSTPAPLADMPAPGGDPTPWLERLERALQRGELDDMALGELRRALGPARCAPLMRALDDFDFEAARTAVAKLRPQATVS